MKYPQDLDGQAMPLLVKEEYPEICKHGFHYLDLWPISQQMLTVWDPNLMVQYCQDNSLPKHSQMKFEFEPMTKGMDIVCSNGDHWKMWRSIFNPGFSAKNVTSLVPKILEEILIFRKWLEKAAESGETVKIDKQAMNLTVDVIGQAVL